VFPIVASLEIFAIPFVSVILARKCMNKIFINTPHWVCKDTAKIHWREDISAKEIIPIFRRVC
jgi:hypothetical protein